MKKFSKLLIVALVFVFAFSLTGCKKDEKKEESKTENKTETKSAYADYIGYQFSGKDPWGNELAVTIRTLENDKLTWTYTDVVGEGESSLTLYSELTTDFKDGSTSFNAKGKADDNNTFDYKGTLTLKDGSLSITFTDGAVTTNSSEGGSSAYQVGPLEEANKTITLTKVVDNS